MTKEGKISVAFEDAWERESVALFSDTLGTELVKYAQGFQSTFYSSPLIDNESAGQVMVDFVHWMFHNVEWKLYLGMDENDGDNSDCGHYVISIVTGQVVRHDEVC